MEFSRQEYGSGLPFSLPLGSTLIWLPKWEVLPFCKFQNKEQIRHGLIKVQMIYSDLQRVKHSYFHLKTSTQLSRTLCLSKRFHGTPHGDKTKWIDQFLQKAFDIIILSCTHGLNLKWHHSWIKGSMSGESVIPKSVNINFHERKAMATHSSILAWKIPWTEEPGGLQSMGSLRVRHDWMTSLSLFTFMNWRRKWQPTPVFLPGESQGCGSLVGCRLWGRTELDTTDAT